MPEPASADRQYMAEVRRDGWTVVLGPATRDDPAYGHTLGLTQSFKHPEILVIGMPLGSALAVLKAVAQNVKVGDRFEPGPRYDDVAPDQPIRFVPVARRHYPDFLATAVRLYHTDTFPALQCVWPDAAGRFPWEPRACQVVHLFQPLLGDVEPAST
ncbi:MAG: DUF4262 domain-containing protein [Fimbriiglobus sp.]